MSAADYGSNTAGAVNEAETACHSRYSGFIHILFGEIRVTPILILMCLFYLSTFCVFCLLLHVSLECPFLIIYSFLMVIK